MRPRRTAKIESRILAAQAAGKRSPGCRQLRPAGRARLATRDRLAVRTRPTWDVGAGNRPT